MLNQSIPLLPSNSPEKKDSDQRDPDQRDPDQIKRVLEAALLTTQDPLPLSELKKLFDGELSTEILRKLLEELREKWVEGSIELVCVASGWRFHAKLEVQEFLNKLSPQKPPRYSRAVLETLAIIAYRQPVTRGDIEEIRGVSVSSPILKVLEARGWIEAIGHRDVPGRPILFATTEDFLNDLNLLSLEELPPLEEPGFLVEEKDSLEILPVPEQISNFDISDKLNLDDRD
jgi:segregation and condensation protein B